MDKLAPRTSAVLALLYPGSLNFVGQEDLDRGSRLHAAMEVWVNNQLFGCTQTTELPEAILPILEWLSRQGVQVTGAEVPYTSPHGYTGTIDMEGTWKGKDWIFDYKFAETISEQNHMQLEAYSRMSGKPAAFLHCPRSGKMAVKKHKPDNRLWAAFLSGVNVLRFRAGRQPAILSPDEITHITEALCQMKS